ncbi:MULTISPECIES: hypothetical protein [unclassified Streptomyces]|uniref:hypothetical protein n=1 Tax=unclassified Streptomyces TaxID=2593676 RepID=UPI002DDA8B66|nr:hypothetical protein [Streptomyces sp. NBC_01750]WSA98109.1 hypothetical protein OIE54_01860 [Streptomyces sp. NBC_01794]WSD37354.1 hypothetical protein OG966_38925 [Streptomyces sp. NBC_01750]
MVSTDCLGRILIAVLPARLVGEDPPCGWEYGPLPVLHDGLCAHLAMRRSHFLPAVSKVLYGTAEAPRRWHRRVSLDNGSATLEALELQLVDAADGDRNAFVIMHLRIDDSEVLDVARFFAGRPKAPSWNLPGTELLDGVATITWQGRAAFPFVHLKSWDAPYTLALVTPEQAPLPQVYPAEAGVPWDATDEWLFTLASRTSLADYPPHPDSHEELVGPAMNHSASWKNLVLNQGAAFVGLRPGNPFHSVCELYVRTLYLDTLLFGILQSDRLAELAGEATEALGSKDLPSRLGALESDLAVFRSLYWKQVLSADNRTNDLFLAFQHQHRLIPRYDRVVTEISELNRIVQTQESRQIGSALGILTVLGLPLGTAFSVLDVLGVHSPQGLLVAMAGTATLSGAMLLTPYGRTVLRSLRAILPGDRQGR